MARIDDATAKAKYENFTFQVTTPDGVMFVEIMEDDKKPVGFHISIGKSGHAISAWAAALAGVMSLALDYGASINELIKELSSLTTDKIRIMKDGVEIRSGPEGVCVALFDYRRQKFSELTEILSGTRDSNYGAARLGDRDS